MESDEEISCSSYDENSTENDSEMKNKIDLWANMIGDTKKTARPEYYGWARRNCGQTESRLKMMIDKAVDKRKFLLKKL